MLKKRNGFTIVELLAVLVLLGIIMGIVLVTVNGGFGNAKERTEDIYIGTIEDALSMYLNGSEAKKLTFNYACTIDKTHKQGVKVNKASTLVSFNNVINSEYHPITASDLINPANKDTECNISGNIIEIYRDEDFVYYYKISRNALGCLNNKEGNITNLPADSECNN